MVSEWLFKISGGFPDLGVRSASLERYKRLLSGGTGSYASFSLAVALVCGLAVGLFLFGFDPLLAAVGFFSVFGIGFFILIKLPAQMEKARIARVEAEMPLVLRTFGMLLDMKVPFVQALRIASRHGEAGMEFGLACDEIERGAGVSKALAQLAAESQSQEVKKAAAQMISAYEHGARGEEMKRIADDMISVQRHGMRDFVSKSSMFGLLFVIFAAVVPTLFLVFSTAGKAAVGFEIDGIGFLLGFLVLLPALSGIMLLISKSQMPPSIFKSRNDGNAILLVVAGVLAACMLFLNGIEMRLAALAVAAGVCFAFLRKGADEGLRIEKIEAGLPDALLGVSGLPKNYGIEKIFERMANGNGVLSEEAGKTLRQLRANVSPEKALEELWKRNGSFMLRRLSELMLNAQLAGANVSEKMHEMAEDLLKLTELKRERENALSMQKYTLMLGGAIVPLILSVSLQVVSEMAGFLGGANSEVLADAPQAASAYVIIYSALAAFYISDVEGKGSMAVAYFFGLSALGLGCIYILSGQI